MDGIGPFKRLENYSLGLQANYNDIELLKERILHEMVTQNYEGIFWGAFPHGPIDSPENRVYWLRQAVVHNVNTPNTWLHDPEISIIADYFKVKIHVYLPQGVWRTYNKDRGQEDIYILNEGNAHFSALEDPKGLLGQYGGSKNKEEEYTFF